MRIRGTDGDRCLGPAKSGSRPPRSIGRAGAPGRRTRYHPREKPPPTARHAGRPVPTGTPGAGPGPKVLGVRAAGAVDPDAGEAFACGAIDVPGVNRDELCVHRVDTALLERVGVRNLVPASRCRCPPPSGVVRKWSRIPARWTNPSATDADPLLGVTSRIPGRLSRRGSRGGSDCGGHGQCARSACTSP